MRVLPAVVALLLVAKGASASNEAVAEALFREGKRLMKEGKFAEACPKLAESHRIDPALGTLINLAACHAAEGRTATAWAEYSQAAAKAAQAGRKEYEDVARAQIAELEPKLSRVRIVAAADVQVSIDGVVLGAGAIGTAVPVDPGAHTVVAAAPGRVEWKTTVEATPGTHEVSVPPLALIPPTPRVAVRDEPSRAPFLTFAGLTLASAALGTYFGVRAFALNRDAEAKCPGGACREDGLDLDRSARTAATVSTIAFGVTLASAVAAVLTYPRGRVVVGFTPATLFVAASF